MMNALFKTLITTGWFCLVFGDASNACCKEKPVPPRAEVRADAKAESPLSQTSPSPTPANSIMPENKVPGGVVSTARRLMHQLNRQGYEVAQGYFKSYTKEDCSFSYAIMGTCYSNNPTAPYVFAVLPTWQNEWLDPMMAGVFGPTHEGYSTSFRVDEREAIVILAQLPPQARYFGLQTNVFTRQGSFSTESDQYKYLSQMPWLFGMFFSYVPWDHTRIQLLSSIGNSNNNVVIEAAADEAFDQERYFVITPDKLMEKAVREAFGNIEVEDRDIFTEPIDETLRVGLNEAADDFYTIIRYAMPDDKAEDVPRAASDAWRSDLPLVVLRIRDSRTERVPIPYSKVQTDPRMAQDPPETSLEQDLTGLVSAVCEKWNQSCDQLTRVINVQKELLMIGPECIKVGMNCLADTQDVVYHFSDRLMLDEKRVYAVVGALSTETKNATYVGLGVNASEWQLGIDNVSDLELAGSARGYDATLADPGKFFVYYFARDCSKLETWAGKYCRSVPESAFPGQDDADGDSDLVNFSLRNYVFPGSPRGAAPESSLSPRVITLERQGE